MPRRVTTAVTCLAITLAYCASPLPVSAEDASASTGEAVAKPATTGRTVRTELEYLTSRQNADPRKASKNDDAANAASAGQAVTPAQPAATEHAARRSRPATPVAAREPVSTGTKPAEHSVNVALSQDGHASRSTTSSRSRKKAHKSSSWSLSFLFSGLRDAILSSRVQYLPFLGSAPVRFKDSTEFDRSHIVSLEEFNKRMEELAAKKKPAKPAEEVAGAKDKPVSSPAEEGADKKDAGSVVTTAASTPAKTDATPTAASIVQVGVSGTAEGNSSSASASIVAGAQSGSSITTVSSRPKIPTSSSASSQNVDYVPVTSDVVLKYFNNTKSEPVANNQQAAESGPRQGMEVKVGVPFVMPYQNDQPLIMDSSANYSQTEGGTQSTSSK